MVGTHNGSQAILECFVEASPPALNFWEYSDGREIENSWKHEILQEEESYRTHMILNITNIHPSDYGLYKCVSKNEKGKASGVFTVFGTSGSNYTYHQALSRTISFTRRLI